MFAPERLWPVEAPAELLKALDFNASMAVAMARACDEARGRGLDRAGVAVRMTELLGVEVSKGMIDAYCSQAREDHNISLVRFKAFVRATGCLWLWQLALDGEGLTLLQGEEALLAQAAMAQKMADEWAAKAKAIKKSIPVEVVRPRL
jgi:hypothetical protein